MIYRDAKNRIRKTFKEKQFLWIPADKTDLLISNLQSFCINPKLNPQNITFYCLKFNPTWLNPHHKGSIYWVSKVQGDEFFLPEFLASRHLSIFEPVLSFFLKTSENKIIHELLRKKYKRILFEGNL